MGYCLNRLNEPVFVAVSKPMLTEFGINYGLQSCAQLSKKELKNETFWKGLQFLLARQSKDGI